MGINWPLIIITGVALLALIIFLAIRNQKDEKSFEEQLNEDYKKARDEDAEVLPK